MSCAEPADNLERKDIPSTNLRLIVGEHRWVGAVSFERSQIFGRTRHALKRLSILASFCQLYKYKLFFQLL